MAGAVGTVGAGRGEVAPTGSNFQLEAQSDYVENMAYTFPGRELNNELEE